MSEDVRLIEWADAAERALATPEAQRLAELDRLARRRLELLRSLQEDPPREPAGRALIARLIAAERKLETLTEQLRTELRSRFGALRKVQKAQDGYRPADDEIPAFVSRTI
ncbi:MAG: hypothetical protein ACE5FG_03820 [Myxococcota bacterium]